MPITERPLEAEAKYRVSEAHVFREKVLSFGGIFLGTELHRDTYLRHPSRDFRLTDEALRIREINGQPFITYKGPRLAGPIKIRPETELPLASNTVEQWLTIWSSLGFSVALQVCKTRESFAVPFRGREITVTLDQVDSLGDFAEIERVLASESEVAQAQSDIQAIATEFGLNDLEKRSYLGMLLEKT
jgi:adenylate cyclase, class 2